MDLFEDTRIRSAGDAAQRTIPVSNPGYPYARCKARQSCGLSIVRYYVPSSATGEWPGRHPNELGPSDVHTMTYPFDCAEDQLRFANAFISWVSESRDASRFSDFGEFINRDVVRHTTVDRLDGNDRTGTNHISALLFSVTKRDRDFRKTYTVQDRRMCADGTYRAAVVIPVATDSDKIRFAVGLAKGHFIDFMHEKTKVYLSSIVTFFDPEAPEAEGAAQAQEEENQFERDIQIEQEMEAEQVLPEEEQVDTEDEEEAEAEALDMLTDADSESDEQVPEPGTADRRALRAISDALFDEKEAMPEGVYLRLSQALKRPRPE